MMAQLRRYTVPLAALALGGALLALAGCGSAANTASAAPAAGGGAVVQQTVTITNSEDAATKDWPRYSPANWSLKAGDTVVLTIKNYDDGTAPLPAGSPYAQVQGTLSGTETVDGKPVSSVPVDQVAHTFTVPSLGLNLVIPAAPKGGSDTIVATFKVTKAGVYYWHCEAPCGTGDDGRGGAMATQGWMMGSITVGS
jgi:plastocyanin